MRLDFHPHISNGFKREISNDIGLLEFILEALDRRWIITKEGCLIAMPNKSSRFFLMVHTQGDDKKVVFMMGKGENATAVHEVELVRFRWSNLTFDAPSSKDGVVSYHDEESSVTYCLDKT